MYQLKLMGNEIFLIGKEEAELFSGKSGLVYIPSIGGLINVSSIISIIPEELAELNSQRKQNRDGQWCIKKFGLWYLENNPEVKVDLNYYTELKEVVKIDSKKYLPASYFAKELSNKL